MKGPDRDLTGQVGGRGLRNGSSRPDGLKEPLKAGSGPEGYCLCPSCNIKVPHKKGSPCSSEKCPDCGGSMCREES